MTFADHDHDDDPPAEPRLPPGLDETIRAVICTSDTPQDLASRVQQAVGEHSSTTDDLHLSHAIAPDPQGGGMLYTALILLRPGQDQN
jgi:hypothetical protein